MAATDRPDAAGERHRFAGSIVYVSAAAGSGIGSAVARAALAEGATVVTTDLSARRVARLEAELGEAHGADRILGRALDAADEGGVRAVFGEIGERFGRLDVLVNSVGVNRLAPLREMALDTWSTVLSTCLTSHFLHVRSAWPLLCAAESPAVVNVSSVVARRPTAFGEAAYAAAKAGVLGLSRAIAAEGAPYGIRSNVVLPGLIWNDDLTKAVAPGYVDAFRADLPFGRAGAPEEVADVVLFLASPASRRVTGEVVKVA